MEAEFILIYKLQKGLNVANRIKCSEQYYMERTILNVETPKGLNVETPKGLNVETPKGLNVETPNLGVSTVYIHIHGIYTYSGYILIFTVHVYINVIN